MENEDCEGGGNQGLLSDRILDLDLDEDQDLSGFGPLHTTAAALKSNLTSRAVCP